MASSASSAFAGCKLVSHVSSNRYTLRTMLGDGSFAEVWQASVSGKVEPCAVKVFTSKEVDESFLRDEAEILRIVSTYLPARSTPKFQEICTATVEGSASISSVLILAMDIVRGPTMMTFLEGLDEEFVPREFVVTSMFHDVAGALALLHQNGIIHRDIKCDNLIVNTDGYCCICDFGISLIVRGSNAASAANRDMRSRLVPQKVSVDSVNLAGTPRYMAPEMLVAGSQFDEKVDVWALGMSIFELILGCSPLEEEFDTLDFRNVDHNLVWRCIRTMKEPRLQLDSSYSQSMRDALYRCVVRNPHERASSAEIWYAEGLTPTTGNRDAIKRQVALAK